MMLMDATYATDTNKNGYTAAVTRHCRRLANELKAVCKSACVMGACRRDSGGECCSRHVEAVVSVSSKFVISMTVRLASCLASTALRTGRIRCIYSSADVGVSKLLARS
jgi:hypothetical protein